MIRPPHLTGMASEYRAAAYFLKQGYQVWWPASAGGPADFVIEKDGEFTKVQVKTAAWTTSSVGRRPHLQVQVRDGSSRAYKPGDFDLLAVVHENRLWVVPYGELKGRRSLSLTAPDEAKTRKNYDPRRWLVATV